MVDIKAINVAIAVKNLPTEDLLRFEAAIETEKDARRLTGVQSVETHETKAMASGDLPRALAFFWSQKEHLEAAHPDQYATIDIEDGRCVVGDARSTAVANFKLLHGDRRTYTFHIGTTR